MIRLHRLILAFAVSTSGLIFAGPMALADDAKVYEQDVRPLLTAYCAECHNADKKKGDLDLSPLKTFAYARAKHDVWENVAERLAAREMPPAKSKQLTQPEFARLMSGLKVFVKTDLDCNQIASDDTQQWFPGYVMSRRLNRAEYGNTIRELIGVPISVGDDLPADGSGGEGFDTVGDALFTSPIHVEKYLDAAEHALDAVLGDTKPTSERFGKDALKAARDRILIAKPEGKLPAREAARKVIESFARRAFRRPLEQGEVDKYLKLFDRASARGDTFDYAIKFALQGVLISPNFLFLVEPEPKESGIHPLADYPLASRLSYFLWASMPDEELLNLAKDGKLQDKEVLRQQVRRMLKSDKSRGLAERFAIQWLGLSTVGDTAKPDPKRFPQFNEKLADAMKEEAILLVDRIFREDRQLTELLSADYTFVNEPLANLYGISGIAGANLRLVTLPDRNRGGILGLAAVHVATSYPLRTSPVLRGKWVLGDVLGAKVPAPPANVPPLPNDDRNVDNLPFRKQLEIHRKNPDCAGCHAKMDPLGFGLENFDAIGRWRDKEANGQPIDPSGELPGGQKFAGPAQLRDVLLKRQDEFQQNLCRKLLGYGLGREIHAAGRFRGQFDQCVIDDCMKALGRNGGKSSAVFETIVLSKPFRLRYTKK